MKHKIPPRNIVHLNLSPDIWRNVRDGIMDEYVLYADHNSGDLIVKLCASELSRINRVYMGDVSATYAGTCKCPQCNSIIEHGVEGEKEV